MKQIEEDPWLALPVKYPTGTQLDGTVRNLTSFGAFVEIEPGIDGFVHVSDMSWTKRVEHPSEVVQKGEDVQVMVLDVDAENKRISLGIKQLLDDPWPGISERFAPGVENSGSVVRVQDKGLVVDLGDDIEGFVPGSHAGVDDATRIEEYYDSGDPIELRVIESDAANRRIVLEATEVPVRKPPKPKAEDEDEDGEADDEPAETAAAEDGAEVAATAVVAETAAEEPEAEVEAAAEEEAAEPEAEVEAAAEEEAEEPEAEVEAAAEEEAEEPEAEVEAAAEEEAEEPEAEVEAAAEEEAAEPEAEVEAAAEEEAEEPEAEVEAAAEEEAEGPEAAEEADAESEAPEASADDETKS